MPQFSNYFRPVKLLSPKNKNEESIVVHVNHALAYYNHPPIEHRLKNMTTATENDIRSFREWWQTILRTSGKFPCYAIFFTLQSDEEVNHYLLNFGKELAIVTGKDCLVIVLGNSYFFTIGNINFGESEYDDYYVEFMEKYICDGESERVAKLFGVTLGQFPCVIFFQDIRSSKFLLLPLQNLSTQDIAKEFRNIFSNIRSEFGARPQNETLNIIERYLFRKGLKENGDQIIYYIKSLIGSTIKSALDAWFMKIIQ